MGHNDSCYRSRVERTLNHQVFQSKEIVSSRPKYGDIGKDGIVFRTNPYMLPSGTTWNNRTTGTIGRYL